MKIIELKEREDVSENKLGESYAQFQELLKELRKKELPQTIIESINQGIEEINSTSLTDKNLRKLVEKKQMKILKLLESELKIVSKNHYRNYWLAVGMCVFGIPIGLIYGIVMDNLALLGIGLPVGMAVGVGLGFRMDKKASEEGRQLNVEINI
jgi:hypothetical protein